MNMREVFLNSKHFFFIETGEIWQENPIFSLEKLSFEGKYINFFNENQIILGLTAEPLIFLEKLQFGGHPCLTVFAYSVEPY